MSRKILRKVCSEIVFLFYLSVMPVSSPRRLRSYDIKEKKQLKYQEYEQIVKKRKNLQINNTANNFRKKIFWKEEYLGSFMKMDN